MFAKASAVRSPFRSRACDMRTNFPSPGRSADIEAVKRHGFHDQGIVVIDLSDQRLSWSDRELARALGHKIYGRSPLAPSVTPS